MSESTTTAAGDTAGQTKTVLITGTSTGIGQAIAVAAARAGWTVIATMRDLSRVDALRQAVADAGVAVSIAALDVTDSAAVQSVVNEIVGRHGRLDAVVNNAGAAELGTVETLSLERFRAAMEVNFFGVVDVTKAAMPHLRASGGKVVTISSVGGAVGQPFNEAYCAAKFAVEGFLESLHPVAKTVGVGVCVIEPGAVASEFVNNAGIDPANALADAGPYAGALGAYIQRTMGQFGAGAQAPEDVALTVVDTLDAADPPFRQQTSDWATQFVGTKIADLDGSRVTGMTAGWVGL